MEMEIFGGWVDTTPHQPIVMMFAFSVVPQDTITEGTGASSAEPFQY
jgi:hypothetical protein